ncbi:hypothetical protein [Psychromonas sp. Urea-02u-13]|uniref:hypothetical protein n=1 Tax=Psychromonas sp. Urea-02u-13 TaxID=2058326 RepID=UPI000C31D4FB|nr:hypothetical protein [Psychromonas sp. Urea-02u-13]PKG40495.1 hypothetical protein CXF74_02590 [Psychromonas sp. Urea-02u-13]
MRYLLLLCLLSLNAHAFTINGKLTGEKLDWFNASSDGQYLTPNYWFKPGNLPKTTAWVPGTFTSMTDLYIELSSGNEHVSVPLTLSGVNYQTNPIWESSWYSDIYPSCNETKLSSIATVKRTAGHGYCIADSRLNYQQPETPFTALQPIIKLDKAVLIAQLKGKSKGVYSGTVSAIASYGFFVDASQTVKTYRNIPITFSVQIEYNPSVIKRINVLGTGHIVPKYDTKAHTVSGQTGFKVSALGYFENGLTFRLINKKTNDYTLKPVNSGSTSIPYSITCKGCSSGSQLVSKGKLVDDGKAEITSPDSTLIPFTLGVNYDNISVKDVEESSYADHFTVMFEVTL